MDPLAPHGDPPSWYFPVAWDLILSVVNDHSEGNELLDPLVDEVMRGYDPRDMIRTLALTAVPIVTALEAITGGDVRDLMAIHIRNINQILNQTEATTHD